MNTTSMEKMQKTLVICDDTTWIWNFATTSLRSKGIDHLRIGSGISLKNNWNRFKYSKQIIILWENKVRPHGCIIDEIKSFDLEFDISERIIILTTAPSRQDVVYFSELGINKIIRIANDKIRLEQAKKELLSQIGTSKINDSNLNFKLHRLLDIIIKQPSGELLDLVSRLSGAIVKRKNQAFKAILYDISATTAYAKGDFLAAITHWEKALDANPNYYRAINNLIKLYHKIKEPAKALVLIKKMHLINNRNIGRIESMGHTYLELKNTFQAEGCFSRVIERDNFRESAKTGLAEVKFMQGDLKNARKLLGEVKDRTPIATSLNQKGIELVKANMHEEALKHYQQANYILPDQQKSALVFYNIGLCYARWGNTVLAEQYLKLALVKQPNYEKAQRLYDRLAKARNVEITRTI